MAFLSSLSQSPGAAELVRVAKERDELKSVLLGLEGHMEDIQTDVQALRLERDQLKAQLKQAGNTQPPISES